MLKIAKHISIVGWLFLGLFFIGNSGLAMVLHNCVKMQLDCCEKSDMGTKDDCGNSSLPVTGQNFKSDLVCHTNTLVGGLTTKSGLLEKVPTHQENVVAFVIPIDQTVEALTSTSVPSLFFALTISPPSVEKCVLNATFLI